MTTAVIMPELGESVEEATITRWLKSEGDRVEEFEPLLEVNTDKVDTEIPSPAAGTLLKILFGSDTVVKAGSTLAWIGEPGEPLPPSDAPESGREKEAGGGAKPSLIREVTAEQADSESPKIRVGRDPHLGYISPIVARIASKHGIDLSKIQGTGQDNRITKRDVLAFIEGEVEVEAGRSSAPLPMGRPAEVFEKSPASTPFETQPLPGEILKLSPIRRSIADHMLRSVATSPHVTTVMEADMSRVVAHRQAFKAGFQRDGIRLTYTAYFISAIVTALQRHPLVNSSWTENGIQLHRAINIGMAVALEDDGLIVPVIKGADGLSLRGIAQVVNDLAERARRGALVPDEVRGGTFTLTNHGTSGSLFATPIINQPQCGILGVGMMQKRVVVIEDAIAIRPMVYISLTFDHRILDGATADYFLAEVQETLETWQVD